MSERVAIIGSRTPHRARSRAVRKYVESLPPDVVIVTGDASGVDMAARLAAGEFDRQLIVCYAAWREFGRKAGPMRNQTIAEIADRVMAFPAKDSVGTWDCLSRFKDLGKHYAHTEIA